MNIAAKVIGGIETAAKLTAKAAGLDAAVKSLVTHWGQLLNTKIKANASGRPGPNAPTGGYRRSWEHVVTSDGGQTTSTNGTNAAQGRRLEYGFTGSDSLGRNYHQPPFPHVAPAISSIEPGFVGAMGKLAQETS